MGPPGDPDDGRMPTSRHRLLALVATALLLALSLGSATAGAAPPPKYTLTVYATYAERSTLEENGFPDPCKTWTQARSTTAATVRTERPLVVGLVRNPITDTVFGLIPRQPQAMSDVYRSWTYRFHLSDSTPECVPCGPSSEYGLCNGSLPDDRGDDDCGAEGDQRRGLLVVSLTGAGIEVSAAPGFEPPGCRAPRRGVAVPLGTRDPRLDRFRLAHGMRELQRLEPGGRTTIRRTLKKGDCSRDQRGPGLRTCIERTVHIIAKRVR